MTDPKLPALPEAAFVRVIPPAHYKDTETTVHLYTAAQLQAYATAAVLADREARVAAGAEDAEVAADNREESAFNAGWEACARWVENRQNGHRVIVTASEIALGLVDAWKRQDAARKQESDDAR